MTTIAVGERAIYQGQPGTIDHVREWPGVTVVGLLLDSGGHVSTYAEAVRVQCPNCPAVCDPRVGHPDHDPCACDAACPRCYPPGRARRER